MKNKMFFRVITMVVLNVFLLSFGLSTFAGTRERIEPRWSHIATTGYLFEKIEYADYDVIQCGGDTATYPGYVAFVSVELQYYKNGVWTRFAYWEDIDNLSATVERSPRVTPGYTYRLLTTHIVYDSNGNILEQFNDQSDYYIASLPR